MLLDCHIGISFVGRHPAPYDTSVCFSTSGLVDVDVAFGKFLGLAKRLYGNSSKRYLTNRNKLLYGTRFALFGDGEICRGVRWGGI